MKVDLVLYLFSVYIMKKLLSFLCSKSIRQEIKDYLFVTLGMVLYAFAVTGFILPHKIVGGGVTGLCTVIYYLSKETVPIGASYFVINFVLLIIGIKVLGPKFGVKTIYAIILGSVALSVFQANIHEALVQDQFMGAIIAAMLMGLSIAMALGHGGSTGGTDIIGLVVTKYRNISPGKVMTYCDIFIIGTTLFINPSFEGLMYGYIVMGIAYTSLDYILTGQNQSAQIIINSSYHEEIVEAITFHFHRGVTVLDGQGWYTKNPKKLLMVVVRKSEVNAVLHTAKMIDPKVFITMASVMGVYGEGFDELKVNKKKINKTLVKKTLVKKNKV